MRTNELNNDPKYSNSVLFEVEPSAASLELTGSAMSATKFLWLEAFRYFKAGV